MKTRCNRAGTAPGREPGSDIGAIALWSAYNADMGSLDTVAYSAAINL